MRKKIVSFTVFVFILSFFCYAQKSSKSLVITGAERMDLWLPYLKGKSVAVFANQTSIIGNTHLVDSMQKKGVNIVRIFGPEHGFRGNASAGEHVANGIDKKSGLPVVSLYGNHKKPTAEDLKNIDVVVFDIQDIGVRFYTYISSLEYLIESCIENDKPLLILDRPNPNGFYVDGPVLEPKFKSFIGMQSVPVVYGMTIAEYAQMLVLERLLFKNTIYPVINVNMQKDNRAFLYSKNPLPNFHLEIITCKNYDHDTKYALPVNPSPNLPEMQSIYLYPSTCFFEGTVLSEGRGTPKPFQIYGHPTLPKNLFSFTPVPNEGAKSSKCYNQLCYGWNLSGSVDETLKKVDGKIRLKYLIDAYKLFPGKDTFFLANNFFNKLAGNDLLMKQIKKGMSEKEIRKSWEPKLNAFKKMRKKYLLYKNFE